jgi:signal transduction histidine kinase
MALVCFGLARHLTAPVARLRDATQRLTEGDLSARVGFGARGGDELISLGRDFDRMAARLQASTESERRLLGDISHELRSPLARLSVALDLVEQGRARAQQRGEAVPESTYLGALERIRRESGRLNELIGQLLELTRLESLAEDAPLSGSAGDVSLDEIVTEVVADAKYEAHSRSCDAELIENQPCKLRGIEPLLHSAIENVVRNAVRYTAPDTSVQVSLSRVEIEGKPLAIVKVRDFGPGVPEESLQALFKPFYRVATGRDRESGGVGLGLAIAQRALRVHGATIEARNAKGGGLEVEIRLPLQGVKALPAPQN